MRLNDYQNRHDLLIGWMLEQQLPGQSILDVGAGDGSFCPEVGALVGNGIRLSGVDPDRESLERNALLTSRFAGRMEEVRIPASSFDAAFALYVLEHVEDPERFLASVARVLRPGGSFFFITPNGRHYFAAVSRLLGAIGAQERVLKILRAPDLVARYHHPAFYRMNSPRVITRLAERAGFRHAEFRFSEHIEEIACYFPPPLKFLPRLWQSGVARTGREDLLLNLMGRLVK